MRKMYGFRKLYSVTIPDFLMLLYNGIELNRSLLQFKHKASFMTVDHVVYPPAIDIENFQLDEKAVNENIETFSVFYECYRDKYLYQ